MSAGTTGAIIGTASDAGGGSVVRVEVSVDGGVSYNTAMGTTAWSYAWTPTAPGPATIKSRAIDNSQNRQDPPAEISVTVVDSTPPAVVSFTPAAEAVNVSVDTTVTMTFSEAIDVSTINSSTIELRGFLNAFVPATISYDPVSFTATLDPAAPLMDGVKYTMRVRGGGVGPSVKDVAGNVLATDLTWNFTTIPVPPQVVSTMPAPNATDVPIGVEPVATFSEALDATSVNTSTVVLRDAANNLIPFVISYGTNDFTVRLTPRMSLQPGLKYTVYLKGGPDAPHITDAVGLPLAADFTWSFTIATETAPITNNSIWPPTATPTNLIADDNGPIELGLKFRTDLDGVISGVRFYKGGAENGGTHVGHLWTSGGTLLGSVTFNNETTSGWQEALFENPIPVTANTTYVVSYLAPQGHYSFDQNYFALGVDNGPLHALSNAGAGGNGVFSNGGFPTSTSQSTNYWVDVVFNDPTPPVVVRVTPSTSVTNSGELGVAFSEPMDSASLNSSTIILRDSLNNLIPLGISYSQGAFTVTLDQRQLWLPQVYTITLKGGPDAPHITNLAGIPLAADFTWSFRFEIPFLQPPTARPILVVTSGDNGAFSTYYKEILRAEGLNNFETSHISGVTPQTLALYDLVILGEMPLTPTQANMFRDWVAISGGNLIAMRPDKQLAAFLGLHDESAVLSNAYLQVDPNDPPGTGVTTQFIPYHGTADLYTPAGARVLATLAYSLFQITNSPAVTIRRQGSNGGYAAAFTFDLAKSIIYSRQGNPAWAGQDRDGIPPIRTNDLFFGGQEPDWIDLDAGAREVPHADELQRLLANMILYMNNSKRPLPRFWYLPNMEKIAILMTGDDQGTPDGSRNVFDMLVSRSAPGCSVANWGCYRATSWLYTNSGLTNDQARGYYNQGFDMGVQVNTGCQDWNAQTLEDFFASDLASFAAKYTSLPAQKSNRTACSAWSDWATQPQVELNHGVRLDETYYYWPGQWVQNRPGFMTGSGFPMRFADLNGLAINVYQAATHLPNDNGVTYPDGINAMLNRGRDLGYYGVYGTRYDHRGDGFESQLVDSAMAHNVPLISADQLLTWLDWRNASSFTTPNWNGTRLEFSISVGAGANNLYAMIPNETMGGNVRSLTVNGAPVSFDVQTIKGRSYAVFRATNGNVVATYAFTP